jgi:beta-lactam-binding protein with PASTA domain/serine/threonine protein kinase
MSLADHPNIVTVHTSGITGDGRPYLVMDYQQAGSLADALPLAWGHAAAMAVKLAGALAAAHHAGILHRDIKPANIVLSARGEPQLADFGVARIGATSLSEPTGGAITATLAYAAPEVIAGGPVTQGADIWSLAATLAATIGGQPPFSRPDETSRLSLMRRILEDPPADLTAYGAPPDLNAVITAALTKDSRERTPDAATFGRHLQSVQHHHHRIPTPMTGPGSDTESAVWDTTRDDDNDQTLVTKPTARRTDPSDDHRRGSSALLLPALYRPAPQRPHTPFGAAQAPLTPTTFNPSQQPPSEPNITPLNVPIPAPTPPAAQREITVQPGDSLWNLAQKYLGDGNCYREIWNLNKDQTIAGGATSNTPGLIQPGWTLTLPDEAAGPVLDPPPLPPVDAAANNGVEDAIARNSKKRIASALAGAGVVAAVIAIIAAVAIPGGGHQRIDATGPAKPVLASNPVIPGGLVGTPATAATSKLNATGFHQIVEMTMPDATIDAGGVIAVKPASGSQWSPSSTVILEVSNSIHHLAVPGVVGQQAAPATDALRQDTFAVTIDPQPSTTVPAGIVVSQAPIAGTVVPTGTNIALTMSSGPPNIRPKPVPNVIGRTTTSAEYIIHSAGFTYTTTTASSTTVHSGTVISEEPAARRLEPKGIPISLVISSGPPSPPACPDVTSQSQLAAIQTLQNAGCTATVTTEFSTDTPTGDVITQTPPPPEPQGTAVVLVVSSGPPPTTRSPCPIVIGQQESAAVAALTIAGCKATITEETSPVTGGLVIDQTPTPPGAAGTLVTIVVSTGPPQPMCPNVVTDTESAAVGALNSAGCHASVNLQVSRSGPYGTVITQTPPPPSSISTPITLLVYERG